MIQEILNPNLKYIVFDTETENLSLMYNKPWQLGLLICEGYKTISENLYYIKWDNLNVSEGAAKATRFDERNYKLKAIENESILNIFEEYLYNPEYLILGHNILQFDIYIHNIWRRSLGRKTDYSYVNRFIDTNAIAKAIKLERPYKKDDNFLAWQYQMLNVRKKGLKSSLTHLGKENDIEWDYDNLHEGLKDCQLNNLIWNRILKNKMEGWLMLK